MKPNSELLKMYKEEKTMVIGAPEVRTGLEHFPSFSEWKQQYVDEYNATHVTVTVEEADAQFEEVIDEAEAELQNLADGESTPAAGAPTETELGTAKAPGAGAPTETELGTAKAPGAGAAPTKKVGRSSRGRKSKTELARTVFNNLYPKVVEGKKTRKDVISKMVEKAGLTANGAATYYQKFKKER